MENSELTDALTHLKNCESTYSNATEINVLEQCCFIVEVGALTVTTDEYGNVITKNVEYPTQFTEEAVEKILLMNWCNGRGQRIFPVVYSRNDWYREKITAINETRDLLNDIQYPNTKNV